MMIFDDALFLQVSWIACGYYHSALVTESGLPIPAPPLYFFWQSHYFAYSFCSLFYFLFVPFLPFFCSLLTKSCFSQATSSLGESRMEGSLAWVEGRGASRTVQGNWKSSFEMCSSDWFVVLYFLDNLVHSIVSEKKIEKMIFSDMFSYLKEPHQLPVAVITQ